MQIIIIIIMTHLGLHTVLALQQLDVHVKMQLALQSPEE